MRIQLRRDTSLNWSASNPVLAPAEIGVDLDVGNFKLGNGNDDWNNLPFFGEVILSNYYTKAEVDALISGGGGGGPHTHPISDIVGLQVALDGKAPLVHTHVIADVTGLQAALDNKSDIGHTHTFASLTSKPTTLAGYGITDAAALVHTHDDRYYTETEIDTFLAGKSDVGHTHTFASLTSKPTTIAGYGITDAYTKAETDTLLAGKSDVGHTHNGLAPSGGSAGQVLKKISGTDYDYSWQADLQGGGGAPIASSTVTGTVKTTDDDADPIVYRSAVVDTLLAGKISAGGGTADRAAVWSGANTLTAVSSQGHYIHFSGLAGWNFVSNHVTVLDIALTVNAGALYRGSLRVDANGIHLVDSDSNYRITGTTTGGTLVGTWNVTTALTVNGVAVSLLGHTHNASDITAGRLTADRLPLHYYSPRFAATTAINFNDGNVQSLTLVSGNNNITFVNPQAGGRYLIELKQPAAGGAGTVTWPATIKWSGGIAPTLTATNGRTDIITLYYNGTNYAASSLLNVEL